MWSVRSERIKTRAAHFPIFRGKFEVIRSDSEGIFQKQVKIIEITSVIQYILTAAQSFGSHDYYNKSLKIKLGLFGVLICENEQT